MERLTLFRWIITVCIFKRKSIASETFSTNPIESCIGIGHLPLSAELSGCLLANEQVAALACEQPGKSAGQFGGESIFAGNLLRRLNGPDTTCTCERQCASSQELQPIARSLACCFPRPSDYLAIEFSAKPKDRSMDTLALASFSC